MVACGTGPERVEIAIQAKVMCTAKAGSSRYLTGTQLPMHLPVRRMLAIDNLLSRLRDRN